MTGFAKGEICGYINRLKNRRGAPVIRAGAEIKPAEPDPDHAGVGITMEPHLFSSVQILLTSRRMPESKERKSKC